MDAKGVLFFLSAVFAAAAAASVVSAAFSVDLNASSIQKAYSTGDYLQGSLAITFTNEPADSLITSNFGDSITIKEWMSKASKKIGKDYNCSLVGCSPSYTSKGEIAQVAISLQQPAVIGFSVNGEGINLKSAAFKADTSLPNSCSKQFSMDVLGLGKYAFENYVSSGSTCSSPQYGCFDSSLESAQYQLANLTSRQYCEMVRLAPAPAHRVGAVVSGPLGPLKERLSMKLYNADFTLLYGGCDLPASAEQSYCTIEYPLTKDGDYQVCISSNMSSSAYQIRTEQRESRCGFIDLLRTNSSTIDFEIHAQPLEYASSEAMFDYDRFAMLNDEANLTKAMNDYMKSAYNSSCLHNECYIPFVAIGASQQISISDPQIVYESNGVLKSDSRMHLLAKDAGTLTSGKIVLPLEALNIPIANKSAFIQLNIGNTTAFKYSINVSASQIDIEPTFALIGVPTTFKVKTNLSISQASWTFSDGSRKQGTQAAYTFQSAGSYTVQVTATTADGKNITRSRSVLVGEPKASAEEIVQIAQDSVNALSSQISGMQPWIKDAVISKIDPIALNASVAQAKMKLDAANSDAEYISVIGEVQALNIPTTIGTMKSGKFPIISGYNSIDLSYASSIIGGDLDSSQIRTALTEWSRDNYDSEVEIETIGATFASGTEPVLSRVRIVTNPSGDSGAQRYLIIGRPLESLQFMTGYSQKDMGNGVYLPLTNEQQVVEFYTFGDASIESLGAYILPSLSELQTDGYSYEIVQSDEGKAAKVIYVSIIFLLIAIVVAGAALQYWYINNYERHLFARMEDLFNIMTFIHNSQKAGLKEGDMRRKLLTSGWTREQISYASGKIKGRILGLFGLPIYSIRAERKLKEEIEMRQKQQSSRKVY